MELIESVHSAVQSIFSHKLRSFLTVLGIIIGISSVVIVMAAMKAQEAALLRMFQENGLNLLRISSNFGPEYLHREDEELLKSYPEVKSISPKLSAYVQIRVVDPKSKISTISNPVLGVNENYIKMVVPKGLIYGRGITKNDNKIKNRIIVIPKHIAIEVFGKENAIGETMTLTVNKNNYDFSVVGILKDTQYVLYMPESIFRIIKNMPRGVPEYAISVTKFKETKRIGNKLVDMLNIKHKNIGGFKESDYEEGLSDYNKRQAKQRLVSIFVAGISLLVGGIGIMNVMFVSVMERIHEIGIRKAIGGRRIDILFQFLLESVILSSIGGLIGLVCGIIGAYIMSYFTKQAVLFPMEGILIAVLISSLIGIVFGVTPAIKASRLDPIEALRYE